MVSVERLRQELLQSLNIIESSSSPTVSRNQNSRRRLLNQGRRPTNAGGSSDIKGGCNGVDRVRVSVELDQRAFQQEASAQQRCGNQGEIGARDGSVRIGGAMKDYVIRPHSAKSRASIRRDRPRTPSLSTKGNGSTSREMEVLMRICQDQGTGRLLNPTDFDSRQVTCLLHLFVLRMAVWSS